MSVNYVQIKLERQIEQVFLNKNYIGNPNERQIRYLH